MPIRRKRFARKKRPIRRRRMVRYRPMSRRPELKKYYYSPAIIGISTVPAMYHVLYDLNQGVDENQRIGRKIFVKWITLKCLVIGADQYNFLRFIFVKYKKGAVPATPTWFPTTLNGFVDYNEVYVLRDKMLSTVYNAAADTIVRQFTMRIPINKTVCFDGTTTNTALNSYFFSMVSDSAVVSHPQIDVNFKVTYTDT